MKKSQRDYLLAVYAGSKIIEAQQAGAKAKRTNKVKPRSFAVAGGSAWACLWRSCNALDGERSHLLRENGVPVLYPTRQLARNYIAIKFGYIARRPDLKAEPHGWKMPVPVRVDVTPNKVDSTTCNE